MLSRSVGLDCTAVLLLCITLRLHHTLSLNRKGKGRPNDEMMEMQIFVSGSSWSASQYLQCDTPNRLLDFEAVCARSGILRVTLQHSVPVMLHVGERTTHPLLSSRSHYSPGDCSSLVVRRSDVGKQPGVGCTRSGPAGFSPIG